jgi:colanic acid/amylovoran biosynthesis protein
METKRILVTGLTLCVNRGGPAMALSFMDQIKRHLPAEFIFAVPPTRIELERIWAERYGVEVVPCDTTLNYLVMRLPPLQLIVWLKRHLRGVNFNLNEYIQFWRSVQKECQDAFSKADCIVNLNGIAFVGDGTRSWFSSLEECTSSIYAKKHNKPFFRFIQSYGPFKDWRVRLLAKMEFANLPCVMARGELAAGFCSRVAGNVPVYAFPDVAITLQHAGKTWLYDYLKQFNLQLGDYIVLSPSAVIASIPTESSSSVGGKHTIVFSMIAKYYLSLSKPILFVPHTTSPTPAECDREVCKEVIEMLAKEGIDTSRCYIVNDELDCRELKALISGAQLAIVSRYHALVAALSTGVPVVTVGWNDKYQDLLDFYKSAQFAVDARTGEPSTVAKIILQKANAWTSDQTMLVRNRQPELESMVNKAGKICADWILAVTNQEIKNEDDKNRLDVVMKKMQDEFMEGGVT